MATGAQVRFSLTPLGAHSGKFTLFFHGANDSWIPSLQNQGDEWQRLGQTGSGAQIIGIRGRKAQVKAWSGETDKARALLFIDNLESLEEEVCAVVDCYNRTLKRVRVSALSGTPVFTRGPILSGTTPITYRIECQFSAERLPDG